MKRLILILSALAALTACTKTEVEYLTENVEIMIAPVAGNITKAAITDGAYPTGQHIGMFAYHHPDIKAGVMEFTVDQLKVFKDKPYFVDAEFYYNDAAKAAWGGLTPYYWPITGSLVFAGYSMPAPADGSAANSAVTKNGSATYDVENDKLAIADYTQSVETDKTFDLLWFGRTAQSYNNRTSGDAIQLPFNHALSWITIQVKGDAVTTAVANPWKVTSVIINDVANQGTVECVGTSATWKNQTGTNDITVFTGTADYTVNANGDAAQELSSEQKDGKYVAKDIETVSQGTLVIPQNAKKATVKIEYKSPAGAIIKETLEDIDLSDNGSITWEAGKHYIYTLEFTVKEIKVSPTVTGWPDPAVSTPITVNNNNN